MTRETFEIALEFLERSGIREARLLGGEPTLHPEFPQFANRALERGLRLVVFTNGRMSEESLETLACAAPESVAVLLNVTSFGTGSPEQDASIERVLSRLGSKVVPGVTIDSTQVQVGFLLELITRYGLSSSARLGLAHGGAGAENRHLQPRFFRQVGEAIGRFALLARGVNVRLSLDCGFVPCMFSAEALEALGPDGESLGRRCAPIPDILPDGDVVHCYPLGALHRERLDRQSTAAELRGRFRRRLAFLEPLGVSAECQTCIQRLEKRCSGGCRGTSLRRARELRIEPTQVRLASRRLRKLERSRERWAVPYIDQPPEFWQKFNAEFGETIAEVYFPLPGGLMGSGRPPQPQEHMTDFLRQAPVAKSVLLNPITLPRPIGELLPGVLDQLRHLHDDYGVRSATVSNLLLAERISESLPGFSLTASVLMDVSDPQQALIVGNACDVLVPSSRIMRNLASLQEIKDAFPGKIRLIVNEGCLLSCPYRIQHFHEMAVGFHHPQSLCHDLLKREPWLRLTGSWVLPQHLHLFEGVFDQLKLAGRVTLQDPERLQTVLRAYVTRSHLDPHEIGGGPASVRDTVDVPVEFYVATLQCKHLCHECSVCRDFYRLTAPQDHRVATSRDDQPFTRAHTGGDNRDGKVDRQ